MTKPLITFFIPSHMDALIAGRRPFWHSMGIGAVFASVLLSGCVGPEMDENVAEVDLEIRVSNSLMQDAVFRIALNHGEPFEVDAPFAGTINVRTAFQGGVPAGRLHILVLEANTNTNATDTFNLEDENWVVASVWSDGEEEYITITWHPQEPVHG